MKSLSTSAFRVSVRPPPNGRPVSFAISSRVKPTCFFASRRMIFLQSSGFENIALNRRLNSSLSRGFFPKRILSAFHELADCSLCEFCTRVCEVELECRVCEADLDKRGECPCVTATNVCCADDCCVFSLVTDVHCVVRVVRSTEFSDTSLIWSDGERVCGTALVLKVVAEETKSGPSVLVHKLGQVPCVQTCVGVTGCDRSGSTTCCCKDCCTLRTSNWLYG